MSPGDNHRRQAESERDRPALTVCPHRPGLADLVALVKRQEGGRHAAIALPGACILPMLFGRSPTGRGSPKRPYTRSAILMMASTSPTVLAFHSLVASAVVEVSTFATFNYPLRPRFRRRAGRLVAARWA